MISHRALIALETSAGKALRVSMERPLIQLREDLSGALGAANTDRALDVIAKFDLTTATGRVLPVLEELAMSTAIFGASRGKPAPETRFVKGHGYSTVMKAASLMATMAHTIGKKSITRSGHKLIAARSGDDMRDIVRKSFDTFCCPHHVLKAEPKGKTIRIPADQDDISDALSAATLGNGRLAADAASNLTTTRLAAFGYLSQAADDGKTGYQITAVLDESTCPVCAYMDGKVLDVKKALQQSQDALETDDPDELEDLAPWPGQSRDDMKSFLQMDVKDLESYGYMTPPFHPACRCILVDIGTVEQTLRPQTASEAEATTASTGWFSSILDLMLGKGTKGTNLTRDMLDDP